MKTLKIVLASIGFYLLFAIFLNIIYAAIYFGASAIQIYEQVSMAWVDYIVSTGVAFLLTKLIIGNVFKSEWEGMAVYYVTGFIILIVGIANLFSAFSGTRSLSGGVTLIIAGIAFIVMGKDYERIRDYKEKNVEQSAPSEAKEDFRWPEDK